MALTTRKVDMQEVNDLSNEIINLFAESNPPMTIATLATVMTLVRLFAGQQDLEMEADEEIKHIQDIITTVDALLDPVPEHQVN